MIRLSVLFCMATLLSGTLSSCRSNMLNAPEYIHFITDSLNGLRKTVNHDRICLTVQFQPIDYLCLLETTGNIHEMEINKLRAKYEGLTHFKFSIGSSDQETDPLKLINNGMAYEDAIVYFAFDVKRDFCLVSNGDTLACVIHHFDRSYGLRPIIELVLGFPQTQMETLKEDMPIKLCFYDRLYGSGYNEFVFLKKDLIDLPILKNVSL